MAKTMVKKQTNEEIAAALERIAQLLEMEETNPYRVRAYHNAASTIRNTTEPVAELAGKEDRDGLMELPGIGEALASLIIEYVNTGGSDLLRRLEEQTSPESAFTQVPGIGETLAHRIYEEGDIHTLEELEIAAYDGRLRKIEGFGDDRVKAVRAALAGMLSDSAQRRARQRTEPDGKQSAEPSIDLLLDVDAEYRRRGEAGELETIAPKRFNPKGESWLPIMHAKRSGWSFTVLFSNTARAHEAGKTNDWVVIYFEREGQDERQRTVVTEPQGALAGKRVVRGREQETSRYYEK
jgi:hypothetical protein